MDWIAGIQRALDYVEDNITEELDYGEIARRAACSTVYFQRIFGILCGFPLGEYIRNRRLTLAGSELASTEAKVIDIALKYGYESPESFTRAFSKFHGITPSDAKKDGAALKSFSRLSVQIILKGGSFMDYKIVEKSAFYVIEKAETQNTADGENFKTIPEFWRRSHMDGTVETVLSHASDKSRLFGICYGSSVPNVETFEYAIAAECDENTAAPEGYRVHKIPERTWAVFECMYENPSDIQDLWRKICSEFFPASEYVPTCEMDIEVYSTGSYKAQTWVPVLKR